VKQFDIFPGDVGCWVWKEYESPGHTWTSFTTKSLSTEIEQNDSDFNKTVQFHRAEMLKLSMIVIAVIFLQKDQSGRCCYFDVLMMTDHADLLWIRLDKYLRPSSNRAYQFHKVIKSDR
jgi:hypothetical protein